MTPSRRNVLTGLASAVVTANIPAIAQAHAAHGEKARVPVLILG